MKKVIAWALMAAVLAFAAPAPAQAQTPSVPVRQVFQALHAQVTWNDPVVRVTRGADVIVFRVGSNIASKNGTNMTLSEPIRLVGGTAVISTVDIYPVAQNWRGLQDANDRLNVSGTTHTIASGESLWGISRKYGVTVDQIRHWNHLKSDLLLVGERIYVEEPYLPHTVVSGETLWKISQAYTTTVGAIAARNGLTSYTIYPGQSLKIPVPDAMRAQPRDVVPEPPAYKEGLFPFINGSYQQFGDTWGESRSFGGERAHEGVDIMADEGVPLFSATDGTVVSYGWLQYGGWRLSIRASDGSTAMYYAHMAGYAPGIYKGAKVKKGQLIGYNGATGYGEVGTTGKFAAHLHFGMYDTSNGGWKAFNPYPYLKWWEQR